MTINYVISGILDLAGTSKNSADGTPPHRNNALHPYLDTKSWQSWIERTCFVPWPRRLLDQTPLDFFVQQDQGYLYFDLMPSFHHLKDIISQAVEDIDTDTFEKWCKKQEIKNVPCYKQVLEQMWMKRICQ